MAAQILALYFANVLSLNASVIETLSLRDFIQSKLKTNWVDKKVERNNLEILLSLTNLWTLWTPSEIIHQDFNANAVQEKAVDRRFLFRPASKNVFFLIACVPRMSF